MIFNNIIDSPFALYCKCKVEYDGRANSVLEEGNYLILYKSDQSLTIHGGNKVTPRNYQTSGSKLFVSGYTIISTNKKETIKITISEIIYYNILSNWSNNDVTMTKTEKDLVNKIFNNWSKYVGISCTEIYKEYITDHGPVDLAGVLGHQYHIIEVKRRKCTIKDATQLRKYLECFDDYVGYLAGPDISDKALEYLGRHDCNFIKVDFD